jgi:hypothetical protein
LVMHVACHWATVLREFIRHVQLLWRVATESPRVDGVHVARSACAHFV